MATQNVVVQGGWNPDRASGPDTMEATNSMDAMEVYFECITTCSLEDGECVTRCVEEFRERH